ASGRCCTVDLLHSKSGRATFGAHMLTMTDVAARLRDVKVRTTEALRASEADREASVVLVAVVRKFDSKAERL
ncbi:hypothetical protein PHK61_31575, partial [Actinomycetospora lutea]|uniref:hypothetical protein n=1 Tax=Actinomycetospora lutea TaxID=663604 RepID=UPI002365FA18